MIVRGDVTLGILAGGRASRLGGRDKAWLQRDGVPQVLRIARRFAGECGTVLVSANRDLPRYPEHGLVAVEDRIADIGPLGGIEALASACETIWLMTIPVDIVVANGCLLRTLATARGNGVVAEDECLSGGGREEGGEDAERGGLARAVRADEAEEVALVDGEGGRGQPLRHK